MTSRAIRPPTLVCPDCAEDRFALHLHKQEEVGAVRCLGCDRQYLLFDSDDYWFDAIQARYPRPTRCTCRATAFRLHVDYHYRPGGDIETVALASECAGCARRKNELRLDIDYSPSDDLVSRPLRYCANPELRYRVREFSLVVTPQAMAEVLLHLARVEGCAFVAIVREQGVRVTRVLDGERAAALMALDDRGLPRFAWILADPRTASVPVVVPGTARAESAFAMRHEVLRIGAPIHYSRGGRMYFIRFAQEYVDADALQAKSKPFQAMTARFERWLGTGFVSWRGRHCFDEPDELSKTFGDRFPEQRK